MNTIARKRHATTNPRITCRFAGAPGLGLGPAGLSRGGLGRRVPSTPLLKTGPWSAENRAPCRQGFSDSPRSGAHSPGPRSRAPAHSASVRPGSPGVAVLRAVRDGHRRADHRTPPRPRRGNARDHRGHRPGPRGTGAGRRDSMGAVRLLARHGVAHLRRVHVRAGLREDRPGPADRAGARACARTTDPGSRLCGRARRPRAGPLHAVQYRPERGHGLSDHQEHSRPLRLLAGAERANGSAPISCGRPSR
jgi:hypothetical protein